MVYTQLTFLTEILCEEWKQAKHFSKTAVCVSRLHTTALRCFVHLGCIWIKMNKSNCASDGHDRFYAKARKAQILRVTWRIFGFTIALFLLTSRDVRLGQKYVFNISWAILQIQQEFVAILKCFQDTNCLRFIVVSMAVVVARTIEKSLPSPTLACHLRHLQTRRLFSNFVNFFCFSQCN